MKLLFLTALLLAPTLVHANGQLTVLAMLRPPPPPEARATPPAPPPPSALHITHQRVSVRINDHAAVTHVDQQFTNPLDAVLEGQYEFRLSPQASVSDFAIWDDKTRVPAVIRRREEARAIYDNIVNARRDPGLLEQVSETLFNARVFPILPNSDKRIEIEYRESLRVEDGIACYRYPVSGSPVSDLAITLDIQDTAELTAAWSPTPGVAVHHHSPNHISVSYEAKLPTSDLLVYYSIRRPESGLKLVAHRPDVTKPGYWMLSISPPATGQPRRPKDVMFVVDTSGSMAGAKLEQAQRALTYCLDALSPDDRFNLVRFSSTASALSPHALQATQAEKDRAKAWVAALHAEGDTNFEAALTRALSGFAHPGETRPHYLVFVTDGEPTAGARDPVAIRQLARTLNTSGARLFTFGIDEAQHLPLLTGLAADHRGEALSVKASDDLSTQLPLWVKRLTVPLFEDPRLEWSGVSLRFVHPERLPHFYLGRQLTVTGRYDTPGEGHVTLHAYVDGEAIRLQAPVTLPATTTAAPQIARIWAQEEATALPPERREEIVALSMEHHFITPYTSLIAVPDAERARLPEHWQRILAGPSSAPSGGPNDFIFEQETDVNSIFQAIAERGHFNVVVDPRVRQKMTVNLRDVDPIEGLETIAKLNGLRIKKIEGTKGTTYAIARPEIISQGFDMAYTRAVQLKNARAADVAKVLTRGLGTDTNIAVENDARTNKLVLRGTPEVLERVQETIRALDQPQPNAGVNSIRTDPVDAVDVHVDRPKKSPVPKYDIDYLRGAERRAVPVRIESVWPPLDAKHYYQQKQEALRQIKEEDFSAGLRNDPPKEIPSLAPAPLPPATPAPSPPIHAMDYQFRLLQQRAATLKLKLALLRARAAQPLLYIESVRLEPDLISGGSKARLSLVAHGPGKLRVTWSAGSGTLLETGPDGAIWQAPRFPGTHTIDLRVQSSEGASATAKIELVVFEPGQITYSLGFLQAKIAELQHQIEQLIAEQEALVDKLAR